MERKEIVNLASSLCELGSAKGNWHDISHLAGCVQLIPRDDSSLTARVVDRDFFSTVYWTWSPMMNHPKELMGVILPFILGASFQGGPFPVQYRDHGGVLIRHIEIHVDEIMVGLLRWGIIPEHYNEKLRWSTSLPVPHFAADHFVSFVETDDLKKAWQSSLPLTPSEVSELDHPTTVITLQWSMSDLMPDLFGVDLLHDSDHREHAERPRRVASPIKGSDSSAEVSFYKWNLDEVHPILSFEIETEREGFRLKYISLFFDSTDLDREIEVYLSTQDILSKESSDNRAKLTSVRSEADLSTAILESMKELGFDQVLIVFGGLSLLLPDAC